MKFTRSRAAISLMAVGTLVLSACGGHSDTPSASKSSTPVVPVDCGGKKKILAAGSSAQKNAIEQFVYAYIRACPGHTLDYSANGSGKGIGMFNDGQTDLAGTDSPMKKDEASSAQQRCGSPAWHLPVVFGPIAVIYNIKGVSSLNLNGPTMAKIFNGTITKWDDPLIKETNAGTNLPPTPIHVIFRGDESGTSDNFQKYLDAASDGAWGKGAGKKFNGGVGEGAVGNDGIAHALPKTDGSIAYTEWSFAEGHQLDKTSVITSAGPEAVPITTDSVSKTIAGATIIGQGNDLVLDTTSFYKPKQTGAYPIVLATYEVVCSHYPDTEASKAVRAFMQATIGDGQIGLDEYGYIPLPNSFQTRLVSAVNSIA